VSRCGLGLRTHGRGCTRLDDFGFVSLGLRRFLNGTFGRKLCGQIVNREANVAGDAIQADRLVDPAQGVDQRDVGADIDLLPHGPTDLEVLGNGGQHGSTLDKLSLRCGQVISAAEIAFDGPNKVPDALCSAGPLVEIGYGN
jgi:hypothetical protein